MVGLIYVSYNLLESTRRGRFLYSTTWAPSGFYSAHTDPTHYMDASPGQGRAATLTSEEVKTVMYHVKRTTLSAGYLSVGGSIPQGTISRHIGAVSGQREGSRYSPRFV